MGWTKTLKQCKQSDAIRAEYEEDQIQSRLWAKFFCINKFFPFAKEAMNTNRLKLCTNKENLEQEEQSEIKVAKEVEIQIETKNC